MSAAAALGASPYLSLTTYRKDGTPVATPVWVAQRGGFLFVWTQSDSGKAKRIRRDPGVKVAACDVRGRLKSSALPATARIISGGGEEMVRELMAAKYGWQLGALLWWQRVRRVKIEHIGIQITMGDDPRALDESIPEDLADE